MIAYVTSQGARIEKEGRRLIVHGKDFRHILFAAHLEQLVLFGNVNITAPAMFTLLKQEIDTVFLRADGRYMGRLAGREPANVMLRKRQFALCDDTAFRVRAGRSIVQAKILNQATLLARIKRARNRPAASVAADNLRKYAAEALHASSCAELRGIEGRAAALYFQHLPLGFLKDWGFERRVRRPPTDPVNCVLSFLYTMLTNRCYAAVRVAGLDPQPGILHELSYGRDSLPLDLIEEFRTMLADTLTLSLFNMNMLDWDDFRTPPQEDLPEETEENLREDETMNHVLTDPLGAMSPQTLPEEDSPDAETPAEEPFSGQSRALLLTNSAMKTVITAFSKKLETSFLHPVAGKTMTYAEAIIHQARQLRRLIDGSADAYTPLMLR
ncbi:CRISPR-associated endonuclease Cas1 [uncultured Mailhella sp.]|uniref:CRISPR-associated endonuclease Cas1 n=1 Tax=uncultured Mailhella sp. TaxID=1981031 RepID=UPI0026052154|nr:CRISPR-associated endonuclease Cas1 [uncultured Mailhella sp.]